MIAEASNAFMGQWVYAGIAILGLLGLIAAPMSYFATRREMDKMDERVSDMEKAARQDKEDLITAGERRSYVLHNRINPLVENTAAIKAQQEAFVQAFDNFTQVMKTFAESTKQQTEILRDLLNSKGHHRV